MPIRIFWAEPGPEADAALQRYWNLAYEIAADIISREAVKSTPEGEDGAAQKAGVAGPQRQDPQQPGT